MRAPVIINARQNRLPHVPLRGASGVLDPARFGMTRASCSSKTKGQDDDHALRPHPAASGLILTVCTTTPATLLLAEDLSR
jgi:hypothetical protein